MVNKDQRIMLDRIRSCSRMNWHTLSRSCVWLAIVGFAMVARAPDLRVIDLRQIGTNNTWQLRWNSTPGADYQLQRSKDDRLATGGMDDWLPLLTLRATNTQTSVDDPAGPLVTQRFYRVVEFTNTVADTQPPTISYVGVEAASTFNGSSALRVRFLAGDNIGVSSVIIREGATTLGLATPTGGSNWVMVVPATVGNFQARLFTGVASDPSGNTAQATGGVLVSTRIASCRWISMVASAKAASFPLSPPIKPARSSIAREAVPVPARPRIFPELPGRRDVSPSHQPHRDAVCPRQRRLRN